ncbi:MAG TPA: hypothetical protein VG735_01155 [Caulobacterales bacterium]|nr:hypothetical protein [Caulobacterales bacterium]
MARPLIVKILVVLAILLVAAFASTLAFGPPRARLMNLASPDH